MTDLFHGFETTVLATLDLDLRDWLKYKSVNIDVTDFPTHLDIVNPCNFYERIQDPTSPCSANVGFVVRLL